MTLSLYKFRKNDSPTPATFVQMLENEKGWWLLVEGTLTHQDIDRSDLIYCAENMTHEVALEEIERLTRSGL